MEHIDRRLISWASVIEPKTLEQARRTAAMPFIHPHVALMPDAHLGLGATVGSVIPTLGAMMPAAVGVDIGCGMIAVRTQFTRADLTDSGRALSALRQSIEAAVPTSAGAYNVDLTETAQARVAELESGDADPDRIAGNWRLQLGTLGSGNHFIEVSVDEVEPGVALPALGLARRRQPDGAEAHRRRAKGHAAVVDPACRTPTWPTWSRAPGVLGLPA